MKTEAIHSRLLTRQKWLRHAFGTRHAPADLGLPVVRLKQIHSDVIHLVDGTGERLAGDALVTARRGLAISIYTADCLPLLLADPEHRVVAAVHAGWRGTLKRIAEKTVGVMQREFGTNPSRLLASLGPAIHACCYEVGPEVITEFESQFSYAADLFPKREGENPVDIYLPRQALGSSHGLMRNLETGRAHLDLEEANRRQLLIVGVPAKNIEGEAPCTACRVDLLHSRRKEGPRSGKLVTAIAVV